MTRQGLKQQVELHLLMGGAVSNQWDVHPEKDCILVGTQDQLLSRALNRGYSMSRYRWPIQFALLNNDCLWVMDEVQLMGAGLGTTVQLQGLRERSGLRGTYGITRSLWMSATLDREALRTVDYQPKTVEVLELSDHDRQHPVLKQRIEAKKPLQQAKTSCAEKDDVYGKALASEVLSAHIPGSLTLVICNRVSRAQAVYRALKQTDCEKLLIHSRYRPAERKRYSDQLKNFSGILVATQAIEAGIDISAKVLFTELAPWSSLVQRFGRCNRYGESSADAQVYWIDIPDLKKRASPYEADELAEARSHLLSLSEVGSEALSRIKIPFREPEGLVPRKQDLIQLFDTSTDLAGHDIDVSSFIRESDDSDVLMAWRSWEGDKPPAESDLRQEELCRVSIGRAKSFLDQVRKQKNHPAWVWEQLQGQWVKPESICPGMRLLLHCSGGGYSEELGFTGNPKDIPSEIEGDRVAPEQDANDPLTFTGEFVTLSQHSIDVAREVRTLCEQFLIYQLPQQLLERTGAWHDLGKAHPAFQAMLTYDRPDKLAEGPWAKSEEQSRMPTERRGFRHELVSALLALQQKEPFLLTYLVAAHHGKVRMTIQPRPHEKRPPNKAERYALGVWQGDEVPEIWVEKEAEVLTEGLRVPAQAIQLDCMELGEREAGASWAAQAIGLLEEYGPFRLAFLEALIRIADWRASASKTVTEENP